MMLWDKGYGCCFSLNCDSVIHFSFLYLYIFLVVVVVIVSLPPFVLFLLYDVIVGLGVIQPNAYVETIWW